VIIDPLAMPVGAMPAACTTLVRLVRRVSEELGINTVCGASNVSFGIANRPALSVAFILMAIGAGMTCAITNPLEERTRESILAANVMMSHDLNCQTWLACHRPGGEAGNAAAEGRRERRAARRAARGANPLVT